MNGHRLSTAAIKLVSTGVLRSLFCPPLSWSRRISPCLYIIQYGKSNGNKSIATCAAGQGRANSDHWSFLLLKMNFFWPAVRAIRSSPSPRFWRHQSCCEKQMRHQGTNCGALVKKIGRLRVLGVEGKFFCCRLMRLLLTFVCIQGDDGDDGCCWPPHPHKSRSSHDQCSLYLSFVFDHWSNWNRSVRARARTRSAATKSPAFSPPLWKE